MESLPGVFVEVLAHINIVEDRYSPTISVTGTLCPGSSIFTPGRKEHYIADNNTISPNTPLSVHQHDSPTDSATSSSLSPHMPAFIPGRKKHFVTASGSLRPDSAIFAPGLKEHTFGRVTAVSSDLPGVRIDPQYFYDAQAARKLRASAHDFVPGALNHRCGTIFRFNDLPAEVRNNVFQQAFIACGALAVTADQSNLLCHCLKYTFPVNLLRVERQIYKDAVRYLYEDNTFTMAFDLRRLPCVHGTKEVMKRALDHYPRRLRIIFLDSHNLTRILRALPWLSRDLSSLLPILRHVEVGIIRTGRPITEFDTDLPIGDLESHWPLQRFIQQFLAIIPRACKVDWRLPKPVREKWCSIFCRSLDPTAPSYNICSVLLSNAVANVATTPSMELLRPEMVQGEILERMAATYDLYKGKNLQPEGSAATRKRIIYEQNPLHHIDRRSRRNHRAGQKHNGKGRHQQSGHRHRQDAYGSNVAPRLIQPQYLQGFCPTSARTFTQAGWPAPTGMNAWANPHTNGARTFAS